MRLFVAALVSLSLASPAAASTFDSVQIGHEIDDPVDSNGNPVLFDGNPTLYQLAGQSAFIQTRTSSSTSGGQLDGAAGFGFIEFTEVFPPALLTDYLSFSYLGVVDLNGTDLNGDPVLLDRSIVIAYRVGVAEGMLIEDLFPAYTESALVSAFTTVFDSPEFLDMAFSQVGGQPNTSGLMTLADVQCSPLICNVPNVVQYGEALDLIAFIGGPNGDEGVRIGRIYSSASRITMVVPEPSTLALFGVGALGLLLVGRRRAA
jgi:hypothetical protein